MVVLSEMGRTPALNGLNGRDHWPYTSAMLVGPGLTGGRVVGGMDSLYYGHTVDPDSAEIGGDAVLSAETLGATLMALADMDPAEQLPGIEFEKHPNERNRVTLFGSLRWFVPKAKLTLEPRYRFYADDWGIRGHAIDPRVLTGALHLDVSQDEHAFATAVRLGNLEHDRRIPHRKANPPIEGRVGHRNSRHHGGADFGRFGLVHSVSLVFCENQ